MRSAVRSGQSVAVPRLTSPRFCVKVDGVSLYFGPEIGANAFYVEAVDRWGSDHVTVVPAGNQ